MPVEQLSFDSAGASSRAHAQESKKGLLLPQVGTHT